MKTRHGGKRKGAWRPKGEGSQVLRIPMSKVDAVKQIIKSDMRYELAIVPKLWF